MSTESSDRRRPNIPLGRERQRTLPNEQRPLPPGDSGAAERLEALMNSPSYVRADQDVDFLQRQGMRHVRLLLEYHKPEVTLKEQNVESTIVVFGGTRVVEPAVAAQKLAAAESALAASPDDPELVRQKAVATRVVAKARYYDVARAFGALVSRQCQQPDHCQFVIVTGGGPGIMEAGNRGAFDAQAKSIGLNITLPHEQFPNSYITPELCFQFRYFALRKMHFLKRAKVLVAFPGGYGTFDELFETLTLIQTRTIDPLPVVLVGEEFWRSAFNAEFLAEEGTIDPEDVDLFTYAETAEGIWDQIRDWYEARGEDITRVP